MMSRNKRIKTNDCFLAYVDTVERIIEEIANGQDVSYEKMLNFKDASRNIKRCFEETVEQEEALTVEEAVVKCLKELGVPQHLGGYKYLISAICYKYKNPEVTSVTKVLYPMIAKQFGSTPSRVERSIRHAIESSWTNGSTEKQHKLFGYAISDSKGKPTNFQFIETISNELKLSINVL